MIYEDTITVESEDTWSDPVKILKDCGAFEANGSGGVIPEVVLQRVDAGGNYAVATISNIPGCGFLEVPEGTYRIGCPSGGFDAGSWKVRIYNEAD